MPIIKEAPKLLNFFIFNSKFGQKEGHEHEKLLYYYPKSESLDSQVRNVGLAEAITRFASTFNKKEDCESLHTQKTHQVYYQPEPNIWMIMTVTVGWIQREKESGPVREYHSEGVQDQVLKAHLINAYKSFRLSHFTFTSLLDKKESVNIKEILSNFFEDFLSTRDLVKGSILTLWCGVSFLPLDKQSFLRVHCTLSLLQTLFPSIVHTAFMYRNNFAWCGFNLEDFQPLSQYLICRMSQSQQDFTSSQSSTSQSSNSSQSSSRHNMHHYSRFIGEGSTPSDIVYIQDRKKVTRPHHLVIYILAGACVCMSFPVEEKFSTAMFDKLGRLLEARISQLASDIGEQLNKRQQPDNFRYLYHNHMNLATKSSIHGINELPVETMQTIVDMHSDLVSQNSSELIVKTALDHWVVGRSGNGRESYIVVSHKNANLVEITDEVNRMCDSQFSSIFMVD